MTNDRARLVELSVEECWELLATAEVARVVWTTATGPEIVPVTPVLDGTTIRFRTTPYSALVQRVDAERVAVEADVTDPATRTGWSVVARGRAEVRYGADGGPEPEPWADGTRRTTVVVQVDQITGRRLVPVTD